MFKILLALGMVLAAFGVDAAAQACGYSFAKFAVIDAAGKPVRGARFQFLENGSNQVAIHSSNGLRWVEEESNYLLSEGMCGGHRNVRVKVGAEGFETIESLIDLPLTSPTNPLIYRIVLKKNNSAEIPSFEHLSQLKGTIYDAFGAVVPGAGVVAKNSAGRSFSTKSGENGEYAVMLPYHRYDPSGNTPEAKYVITFTKSGFQTSTFDYVFIPSQFGAMNLDVGLAVLARQAHLQR